MYNLIKINQYAIPEPLKGNLSINIVDKYNEYETESGDKITESIREGMIKASVTYNGLFANTLQNILSAITLISSVIIYNPFTGTTKTIMARITGITSSKIVYNDNVEAWSLSFNIEEV